MSTFALVVFGVGACIGVVTSLLLRPDEPATSSAPRVRAPRQVRASAPVTSSVATAADGGSDRGAVAVAVEPEPPASTASVKAPPAPVRARPAPRRRPARPPEGEPNLPTPWYRRALAVLQLAVISVLLGVAAAAGIGLVVLVLFGLLRGSVG